ncbi:MAG: lipoyl protein ligase domain-containing protein, partial [Candidatus Puniceispirillaceae bacterium]
WMTDMLASFGVEAVRREGLPGLWVARKDVNLPDKMDKIVAVGVRLSRWVTMHGLAVNIDPDLGHFDGIVPCGVRDGGVTSLADLGYIISREEVEIAARDAFTRWFGPKSEMGLSHLP